MPVVRAAVGGWLARLLLAAICLCGCFPAEDAPPARRSAGGERPLSVAGVELYRVPDAVARECRSTQERARIPILCPTRLPRPVRDFAGSSALPLDALTAFEWGSGGTDFSYSAETGRHRLDDPARFFHLQVIERDQPLPRGARPATIGGRRGLLAPATSRNYASETYFANHLHFFWTEAGVRYAATLHDFGRRTRPLLSWLVGDLRPARDLPRRAPAQRGVRTVAVPVPGPVSVAAADGEVWVAGQGNRVISGVWLAQLEPAGGRVSGERVRIGRGGGTSAVLVDGSVWVAHRGVPNAQGLQRLDRGGRRLTAPLDVRPELVALARTAGSLWLVDFGAWSAPPTRRRGVVLKTDRRATRVVARIRVGRAPAAIAAGAGALWVSNNLDDTVTRIDPRGAGVVDSIPVGAGPVGLAYGYGAVWVANNEDGTVSRIDPSRGRILATTRVGRGPRALAAGHRGVWVTNDRDDTVMRIDPRTNRVIETIRVGAGPTGIAVGEGAVWVASNLDGTVSRIEP